MLKITIIPVKLKKIWENMIIENLYPTIFISLCLPHHYYDALRRERVLLETLGGEMRTKR